MPELIAAIAVAVGLPLLTAAVYLAAWRRPEPGPNRDEAVQ
ncbi:hypothetical protein [Nocardia abscessus]|nr:hypothetical protein [Nocardia abscessus]